MALVGRLYLFVKEETSPFQADVAPFLGKHLMSREGMEFCPHSSFLLVTLCSACAT